jgi:hypothetical protein
MSSVTATIAVLSCHGAAAITALLARPMRIVISSSREKITTTTHAATSPPDQDDEHREDEELSASGQDLPRSLTSLTPRDLPSSVS